MKPLPSRRYDAAGPETVARMLAPRTTEGRSMPVSHEQPQPLVSQLLLEDADLRDVVEEFVNTLTNRVAEFKEAYRLTDWTLMQTLAHRLKGAGGSYGYPDISQLAAGMEQEFRVHSTEHLAQQLQELETLILAARAGLAVT